MRKLFCGLTMFALMSGCAGVGGTVRRETGKLDVVLSGQPPGVRAEARGRSPSEKHVWVAGYWDQVDGVDYWRAGRWVEPREGYRMIDARYEQVEGRWVLHLPRWRKNETVVRAPAPPVKQAAVESAPAEKAAPVEKPAVTEAKAAPAVIQVKASGETPQATAAGKADTARAVHSF